MINRITQKFPKQAVYGLTFEMKRAAVSVPLTIVEGCARESQQEYLRFLEIAFASLRELCRQLCLSQRLGFVDLLTSVECDHTIIKAEKVLNALVRSGRKMS